MSFKTTLPLAAFALSVALVPALAETQGRADFRALPREASAEVPAAPVVLKPATVREVDRDGDGLVEFGELLEADFSGNG